MNSEALKAHRYVKNHIKITESNIFTIIILSLYNIYRIRTKSSCFNFEHQYNFENSDPTTVPSSIFIQHFHLKTISKMSPKMKTSRNVMVCTTHCVIRHRLQGQFTPRPGGIARKPQYQQSEEYRWKRQQKVMYANELEIDH